MKKGLCVLILATLWIGFALVAFAATQASESDPFVGTWQLNRQKSHYPPGACPQSMVIVMEAAGTGIHYRSETTYADGRFMRAEYTADYNGKEVLVTGSAGLLLPVSLRRPDTHTVVARYTRALQVIAKSRRVVSRDGRFMTITTTSPGPTGKNLLSVGVYEKKNLVARMQ